MKKILGPLIILVCIFLQNVVEAQRAYPVVISTTGILFGKYESKEDVTSYKTQPITISDAKNIFAINAITFDKKTLFEKREIAQFRLTIIPPKGKELTFFGNSSMLDKEMKDSLSKVETGYRIFFELIQSKSSLESDRSTQPLIMIDFTVM